MMMSARRASQPRAVGAKPSAAREGFTLLSVLIAAAILIVGVLTVARSNTAIMAAQTDAGLSTKALEIARGYVEEIRARNPQTLASEAAVTIDDEGKPAVNGSFVRTMTVVSERENLLRVTVSVKGSRADQPVELVTFIYKGVHDE
jgi:Tfp pilus assembly protein PilV